MEAGGGWQGAGETLPVLDRMKLFTVLDGLADQISHEIGDGCLVWRLDREGDFHAVAASHRDPGHEQDLVRLIGSSPNPPRGGWLHQALTSQRATRVPNDGGEGVKDAGLPEQMFIGEILAVPMRPLSAVAVVFRDRVSGRYHGAEHEKLMQMVARVVRVMFGLPASDPAEESSATLPMAPGLLEATSAALWLTDVNGKTLYVNGAACELVGISSQQLINVPIAEFIGGVGVSRTELRTEIAERRLIDARGQERRVSQTARPLFDSHGRWHATLHTLFDIEEQRSKESRLRVKFDTEQFLHRLAEILLRTKDVKTAYQSAVELLAQEVASPLVAIAYASRDHNYVTCRACAGSDPAANLERFKGEYPFAPSNPGRIVIEQHRPLIVRDLAELGYEPSAVAPSRVIDTVSNVCAPIDELGSVGITSPRADAFGDDEFELVQGAADLLTARWSELTTEK